MTAEAPQAQRLTRTQLAVRRAPKRRWLPRRPTRRAMVLVHRWTPLVRGLLLVVETTSGVAVLYHTEYFRVTHRQMYSHAAGADRVTAQQALRTVTERHPEFGAAWVSRDHG